MNELTLVKHEFFEDLKCDIYQDDNEYYMTREQIGRALGYANSRVSISNIHNRNKERFDGMSTVINLISADGKSHDTVVYTRKGIMEICRWSKQPRADMFIDWVWEVMDSLIEGRNIRIQQHAEIKRMIAESRFINSHVKEARELMALSNKHSGTVYSQILDSYASKALVGDHVLPLPELPERTYTATEIGKKLGISANRVGRLANEHNLKTTEYGKWFRDVATHRSDMEVPVFRYYERVIPVLRGILLESNGFIQDSLEM